MSEQKFVDHLCDLLGKYEIRHSRNPKGWNLTPGDAVMVARVITHDPKILGAPTDLVLSVSKSPELVSELVKNMLGLPILSWSAQTTSVV